MLTNEEWDDLIIFELGEDERSESLRSIVERIIAARVRAARAQERQQIIDELHGFLPEWNYPAHVIAAISLELRDRANHIESSQNG